MMADPNVDLDLLARDLFMQDGQAGLRGNEARSSRVTVGIGQK
jgi:hypothetical protein